MEKDKKEKKYLKEMAYSRKYRLPIEERYMYSIIDRRKNIKKVNFNTNLTRSVIIDETTRKIIDEIEKATGVVLTLDCGITNLLCSRITLDNYIERAKNYISMFKILESLEYTKEEINMAIEDNIWIIEDFRLQISDITPPLKRAFEEKTIKEIIDCLYTYSKSKRIFKKFGATEEQQQLLSENIIDKIGSPITLIDLEKLNNLEETSKIINLISKGKGLDQLHSALCISMYPELFTQFKSFVLTEYLAVLSIVNLDTEILKLENIRFLKELMKKGITPIKLYPYVKKLQEISKNAATIENLKLIIQYANLEKLKEEYPVFENKCPVILNLKKDYLNSLKKLKQKNKLLEKNKG